MNPPFALFQQVRVLSTLSPNNDGSGHVVDCFAEVLSIRAPLWACCARPCPFLASSGFVYAVGVADMAIALMLLAGFAAQHAGVGLMVLFLGTLTIVVLAPGVTGFPLLTLAGQFLLKDVVLLAAAATIVAQDAASETAEHQLRVVQKRAA